MELATDVIDKLLHLSQWERHTANAILNKKHQQVFSSSELTYAQYCLLLHECHTNEDFIYKSTYAVITDALKSCCPDFLPPKLLSNYTRDARNNIQQMKNLTNPVFCVNNHFGPCASKLNISKENLHTLQRGHSLNLGAFVEICQYKNRKQINWTEIQKILENIKPEKCSVPLCHQKLQRTFTTVSTKIRKLSKNKDTSEIESLKSKDFFSYVNSSNKTKRSKLRPVNSHVREMKKILQISRDVTAENITLSVENEALHDSAENQKSEMRDVSSKLKKFKLKFNKLKPVQNENRVLKNQISELKRKVVSLKKDNAVKRLNREKTKSLNKITFQKRRISKLKQKVNAMNVTASNLNKQIESKDCQIKNIKLVHSKENKKLNSQINYWKNKEKLEKDSLNQQQIENEDLKQQVIELQQTELGNANEIVTKVDNRYTDDVRLCVMDLQGLDISCNKISSVIKSVGKNIFHQNLQVPGKSTVQNIADEGLVISKTHVAEKIKDGQSWGMFSDGTSRDGRKIVNIGVNVNKSTFCLGYKSVAVEDSETVSNVLKNSIKDAASYVSEPGENLNGFLQSLSTLMSDRSSVMKKSNQLLKEWRQQELSKSLNENQIDDLNFLYCSAHVLLGFHNKIEKDLVNFHKDSKTVFARDKDNRFKRFSNKELASFRLIRTASDCFGPRGDEKNGVRQNWLAYLKLKDKKSNIISYRSNRFNNVFVGALSIVTHKDDIIDFLQNYCSQPNLKLQSILCDILCEETYKEVVSLALIGARVTIPYWELVNSTEHHMDLYKFFQPLHQKVSSYIENPEDVLKPDFIPVFEKYPHQVYDKLNDYVSTNNISNLTSVICSSLAKVIEKQLNDYLVGGKYSVEASEHFKKKTAHSKLTNIQSENLFGDLDFSFQRKRNATLRHHSSIIMLKRNKTTDWLRKKSSQARSVLLKTALKKSRLLRKNEQMYEKEVMNKRKTVVELIKHKKEQVKQKKDKELKRIEKSVREMGGVVKTLKNLEDLLLSGKTCKLKKILVRDQILFCKHFLGKDVNFKLYSQNQTLLQIKQNLIVLLDLDTLPELTTGMWVAVAYQDSWYPGEILKATSSTEFEVNFLHPKKLGGTSFVWPVPKDVNNIDEKFIFYRNLSVVPTPGLRYWIIHEFDDITELYTEYSNKYF